MPITYRLADDNTPEDPTHIDTWKSYCVLAGRTSFLYASDSKLCNRDAMGYIDAHHGRFLTIMPNTLAEVGEFRRFVAKHTPDWAEVLRRPGKRIGDPEEVFLATPAPSPSVEGYRIVWIRSSEKLRLDAEARRRALARTPPTCASISAAIAGDVVRDDTCFDGCWPMMTNDKEMTQAELLLGFVAVLVHALIERDLRKATRDQGITELPLYPEGRACAAPTAARVIEVLESLSAHKLVAGGELLRRYDPTLSALQQRILRPAPSADDRLPLGVNDRRVIHEKSETRPAEREVNDVNSARDRPAAAASVRDGASTVDSAFAFRFLGRGKRQLLQAGPR